MSNERVLELSSIMHLETTGTGVLLGNSVKIGKAMLTEYDLLCTHVNPL